jgi:hypothetical protein
MSQGLAVGWRLCLRDWVLGEDYVSDWLSGEDYVSGTGCQVKIMS